MNDLIAILVLLALAAWALYRSIFPNGLRRAACSGSCGSCSGCALGDIARSAKANENRKHHLKPPGVVRSSSVN